MSESHIHPGDGETVELDPKRVTRITVKRRRLSLDVSARWSVGEARAGEEVELITSGSDLPEGQPATFRIYEVDQDGGQDLVAELHGTARAGEARVPWTYVFVDDSDDVPSQPHDEYHAPEYVFEVTCGAATARTPEPLLWKHWVRLQIQGVPAGTRYWLFSGDTQAVWQGQVAEGGWIEEQDVPPGPYHVVVEGHGLAGARPITGA